VTAGIQLRAGRAPSDLAAVLALHRDVYAAEWKFDERFAMHVEAPLSAFGATASPRDRLWLAEREGRLVGCIAIVAAGSDLAQLRWFLVAPEARGSGLGRRLLEEALRFARADGCGRVTLWTVDLLRAAARLYRSYGFRRVEARPGAPWGVPLVEERYEMSQSTILWRRLDLPGHDVARLGELAGGWQLEGFAAFASEAGPCALAYDLRLTARWRTRTARVRGWLGARSVDLRIGAGPGGTWKLAGVPQPSVTGAADLDLSFTPATNLIPIRRLGLEVGETGAARAAWLRLPELTLEPIEQTYERLTTGTYRYVSAGGLFDRRLTVRPDGFVVDYPGQWRAEATVVPPADLEA
jgi:GNAT superfamily N-acetyltransferase